MPDDSKWLSIPRHNLIWRDWGDDEVVIFNRATGDTHLLSPEAFLVLDALFSSQQSKNYTQLIAQIQPQCSADTSAHDIATILDLALPALSDIGLVACQ